MCGRFVLDLDDQFYPRFRIKNVVVDIKPRFNIAPSQEVPVVLHGQEENEVKIMRWGLIPSWAKDRVIGNKLINARAETVSEKPAFRKAFRKQRCLVPATGFYEWKLEDGRKAPHFIYLKDEKYFAFAGIFDTWRNEEGNNISTFSIITTEPNEVVKTIHNRMPVVLQKEDEQVWLEEATKLEELKHLLRPYKEEMEEFEVSLEVNTPDNDSLQLIKPLQQKLI